MMLSIPYAALYGLTLMGIIYKMDMLGYRKWSNHLREVMLQRATMLDLHCTEQLLGNSLRLYGWPEDEVQAMVAKAQENTKRLYMDPAYAMKAYGSSVLVTGDITKLDKYQREY